MNGSNFLLAAIAVFSLMAIGLVLTVIEFKKDDRDSK